MDIGLAINNLITLPDVTESEITIGEEENRRIIKFYKTENLFVTKNEKGGSRFVIMGDTNYAKGN